MYTHTHAHAPTHKSTHTCMYTHVGIYTILIVVTVMKYYYDCPFILAHNKCINIFIIHIYFEWSQLPEVVT